MMSPAVPRAVERNGVWENIAPGQRATSRAEKTQLPGAVKVGEAAMALGQAPRVLPGTVPFRCGWPAGGAVK